MLGTTVLGLVLGRSQGHRSDSLREPLAVLQAALLGVVGLIMAFGLALAVGALHRHQHRFGPVGAPGSPAARQAAAGRQRLRRQLWALAGQALEGAPTASAPRLYVESLNQMIDLQTVRAMPLTDLRASMVPPPAATGPTNP